jgi:hypothetical protein
VVVRGCGEVREVRSGVGGGVPGFGGGRIYHAAWEDGSLLVLGAPYIL